MSNGNIVSVGKLSNLAVAGITLTSYTQETGEIDLHTHSHTQNIIFIKEHSIKLDFME